MYFFARLPDAPIRLFSALKLQKSDFRDRIKADTLDALLLLKANAKHFETKSLSNYVFCHSIYFLFYSTLLKF